jgi:hypothetical protein
VAVTGDDLGGDRLALQTQTREHARLEVRGGRRVGSDGPAHRSHLGLGEGALQTLEVALGLEGEAGELDPERRRLGVDAVRASRTQRVDVLMSARGEHLDEALRVGEQQRRDVAQLQREAGVQHVG